MGLIKLNNDTEYINSTDYNALTNKLKDLKSILEDLQDKQAASRKLRYAEVDIEVEREASRIAPDELYIPSHLIDTNIRREQPSYVQFVNGSPRAVICSNLDDAAVDMSLLDKDLTQRLRYDGYQIPTFACIDALQANGYGITEIVYDDSKPGDTAIEHVQMGDFAFIADTRDIQSAEMLAREYHYTKTKLVALASEAVPEAERWDIEQVNRVIGRDSAASVSDPGDTTDSRDKSLYRIQKIMFRVNGIVQVAWDCIDTTNGWLRAPRPLYLGDRTLQQENPLAKGLRLLQGNQIPPSSAKYETEYPYTLFPYLISENDTISHLKGRIFLDQDAQEGVSSLMSSALTQARRASALVGSKDSDDPNDDILQQSNIYIRSGMIMNKKVSFTYLPAPDPAMFSAIQALATANQNETNTVSFATKNRKDSRKTATELDVSQEQQQTLTSTQAVLYSLGLRTQDSRRCAIIRARVQSGLIQVNQSVRPLYDMNYAIKPSGDVDVIERQQKIQTMMQAWPVIQNTPAAMAFLTDLLELLFPDNAAKYVATFQQAQQQNQQQQQQMIQQLMLVAKQVTDSLVALSKKPEMFSEIGRIHAFPLIEAGAEKLQQIEAQISPPQQKK